MVIYNSREIIRKFVLPTVSYSVLHIPLKVVIYNTFIEYVLLDGPWSVESVATPPADWEGPPASETGGRGPGCCAEGGPPELGGADMLGLV